MAVQDSYHMYIYKLPYEKRKKLCRILDCSNTWEELGGMQMKLDALSLLYIGKAMDRGQSPSDELLTVWGTQNHTVLQLFVLLSNMQHYQAMMVLKSLVDRKYHRLIYEGEENFNQIFLQSSNPANQLIDFEIENKLINQVNNVVKYKEKRVNPRFSGLLHK